jgi:hypothetical protein
VSTFSQLCQDDYKFGYVVVKPVATRQRVNLFEYAAKHGSFSQRKIAQIAKMLFEALD